MRKYKNIDYLSHDILEEDFVKIFRPIHFIQSFLGFNRVNIKYKFVTEPTPFSQIYSCLVRVLSILLSIHSIINCESILGFSLVTEQFIYFGHIVNQVCNVIIAWQNNFLHGKLNSQLYVKLQQIDRGLISTKTRLNKSLSNRTSIITVFLFSLCIVWILSFGFFIPKTFCPAANVSLLLGMGLYSDIILCIIIIYYISIRIEYINNILAKETNRCERASKGYGNIWMVGEMTANAGVSDQLVSSLHCLLDAMDDWIKLYEFPIFCFMVHELLIDLLVMQSLVTVLKEQVGDYTATLYLSPVFLFMISQNMLCFLSSAVTAKLQKMRILCNSILQYHETGKSRQNAKRIIILLDAKRDMRIYDVFTLSSGLPLSLLGIVASYTIVLFQFALL